MSTIQISSLTNEINKPLYLMPYDSFILLKENNNIAINQIEKISNENHLSILKSNQMIEIYQLNESNITPIHQIKPMNKSFTNLKWFNEHILNFTNENGFLYFYDIRQGKIIDKIKTQYELYSLYHKNIHEITLGTANGHVLSYDLRNKSILWQINDFHTDIVSEIKYHPIHSNVLITGSYDSLINVYNVENLTYNSTLDDIDNSLLYSLSNKQPIHTFNFFQSNYLYCFNTLGNSFELYNFDQAELIQSYNDENLLQPLNKLCLYQRNKLLPQHNSLSSTGDSLLYQRIGRLLNCHFNHDQLYLCFSSFDGYFGIANINSLNQIQIISCKKAHQAVINDYFYDQQTNCIFTVADDGQIAYWKQQQQQQVVGLEEQQLGISPQQVTNQMNPSIDAGYEEKPIKKKKQKKKKKKKF